MRWSADKLRTLLLSGVVLLVVIVGGFFVVANYRAGKVWQRILARNGVSIERDTNGFTYSQSSGGRTIFTLHAAKATPQGKGRYALKDAVLILYGREPGRDDRIYGHEFQYDENQQIARAIGEVHMDLQAPEAAAGAPPRGTRPELSFALDNEATSDPAVIHVRTSGVTYDRKQGLAATTEMAEFRYKGITCTSRGAEFDSGHSVVRLLADVHMSGLLRDTPFTLSSSHVELNRQAGTSALVDPVLVSGDRGARARQALLHLRKSGTVETADASGDVQLRTGTQTVMAPQLTASFNADNKPQRARLFQGVRFADSDTAQPAQGTAAVVDLGFDGAGELTGATASGGANLMQRDVADGNPVTVRKTLADRIVVSFAPGKKNTAHPVAQRVQMTGSAVFGTETAARHSGERTASTQVSADDLLTTLGMGAQGRAVPQHVTGKGHTRIEQVGVKGDRQVSTGDMLDASLASVRSGTGAAVAVSSAVQSGTVALQSWGAPQGNEAPEVSTGHADRAVYDGGAETLTLTGSGPRGATVRDGESQLEAAEIVLHQGTGDSEGRGGVVATTEGKEGAVATHVSANRARLVRATNVSEFFGTDAKPVQLWQGGSQIQAADVLLDGKGQTLVAKPERPNGLVHAVFATQPQPEARANRPPAETRSRERSERDDRVGAIRVDAARLDFSDLRHEATFVGGVRMFAPQGEVTADRAVAFLKPGKAQAPPRAGEPGREMAGTNMGGSLDRMVMLGDVQLKQTGRQGTGAQLTYTAATDSFVLTGTPAKPPRIVAEQGSVVTGATLIFGAADSSIVVAGTQSAPKGNGPTRVHTETDLKQP